MNTNEFLKAYKLKEEGFERLKFIIESAEFIYTLNGAHLTGGGYPQSIGPETVDNLDKYLSDPEKYWISDITNRNLDRESHESVDPYEYPITMDEIERVISVLVKYNITFDIDYKDYEVMSDIRLVFIRERKPRKHWKCLYEDNPMMKIHLR